MRDQHAGLAIPDFPLAYKKSGRPPAPKPLPVKRGIAWKSMAKIHHRVSNHFAE